MENKPREFFIQNTQYEICTATKVSATDPEVNSQITDEVHVIEMSAYEQLQKEKEHIRQHLLAQTKISNELLDEKEKLTQALKVAEKALRYMTEDYDCDPADVADFDKRRADQALEQIKKIMGEGCSNETTKEPRDEK